MLSDDAAASIVVGRFASASSRTITSRSVERTIRCASSALARAVATRFADSSTPARRLASANAMLSACASSANRPARSRTCSVNSATAAGVRYGLACTPSSRWPISTAPRHSSAVGVGSGRSSISGRSDPGLGAGMARPYWYQARCRSAAQAMRTRSATSSRSPIAGTTSLIHCRRCPTVTGSCAASPARLAAFSSSGPQNANRSSPKMKWVSPAVPTPSVGAMRRIAARLAVSISTRPCGSVTACCTTACTAASSRAVSSWSGGSKRGCAG